MTADARRAPRDGHGWWPYLLPYLSFIGMLEVSARVPEGAAPAMLFLKPAVPAALLLYFWRRGAYAELRRYRASLHLLPLDLLVGVLLAGLWVVPFVFFPGLLVFDFMRPDMSEGFDPGVLGRDGIGIALSVRMVGYAVVTPIFEELFMRSFVMRYAEVYRPGGDFRNVAIGHFAWSGFLTTLIVFTITHVPWEYGVMFLWALFTNLWFYYRKDLMAVVIAHAATNASILLFAVLCDGRFLDSEGNPIPLWFFV